MTSQILHELATYQGAASVLSIYLNTDLSDKSKDAVRLMFRDRLRSIEDVPETLLQRVTDYLDFEFDWSPRGLAIFADGRDLWQVIPLPIQVPVQVYWADRPQVRILSDVIARFGAYIVALVDRQSLRVFSVRMGEIQAQTEALGEELKRHRQGGWSAQIYQRHEDNLAMHNLKQSAEVLDSFCERTGIRRLVLGGSPDVLSQFREVLPRRLSDHIVGEFTADVSASEHKALELSLDVASKADVEEEARLVDSAITAANKGENGVIGTADTLYALYQGRARLLLLEESFRQSAYVCDNCGSVSSEPIEECPFCGHREINHIEDVSNLAVRKAIETGADFDIVRDNQALSAAGGIAALLRY